MPLAGDIVDYDARTWVVVDVSPDHVEEGELTVLRRPDDPDLLDPVVVMAGAVKVVGHLESPHDGWIEDPPGIWSAT